MAEKKEKCILAIDPANVDSAFVIARTEDLYPLFKGKIPNEHMVEAIPLWFEQYDIEHVAIEYIQSFGMAVGATVFDTCFFIGRLWEIIGSYKGKNVPMERIFRKEEKLCICGSNKAKDANIRRALIDRFAQHDMNNGRGTKNNPDWFYGFKADIWAAYAVCVTYYTKYIKGEL